MDTSPPAPDPAHELADLRARAYGRDANIDGDPTALARLAELEAALRAGRAELPEPATKAPSEPASAHATLPPRQAMAADFSNSRWLRSAAAQAGRAMIAVGAFSIVLAVGCATVSLLSPQPDVVLDPTADTADPVAFIALGVVDTDAVTSSIRGFESYRGVKPVYFVDADGFQCFALVTRPAFVQDIRCVPPGVDLFADVAALPATSADSLPAGSILHFHHRDDRVEVFLHRG